MPLSILLRFLFWTVLVTTGVGASVDSWIAMLLTHRPPVTHSRFRVSTPAAIKYVELDASAGSFLLKIVPSIGFLESREPLSQDVKLRAQQDGPYWIYHWDQGGFLSTDSESIRLDGKSGGMGVARFFRADSFFGELPFLGIPDYWDLGLQVDPANLIWSYRSPHPESPRHSFTCRLHRKGHEVIAHIEYPTRTHAYRMLQKRILFDEAGNEPRKLICRSGPSTTDLQLLYTIEAIGPLRIQKPNLSVFWMTRYLGPGSRAHLAYRAGKRTDTEIPEPVRASIRIFGIRMPQDVVRWGLWGSFAAVIVSLICVLAAGKANTGRRD